MLLASMLSAFKQGSATKNVAFCYYSYFMGPLRFHSNDHRPRPRNWQTSSSYPVPVPLMPTGEDSPDFSKDEAPRVPRKPQTTLKNSGRSFPEEWRRHRRALKDAHPDGWSPPKKLSREAMDGLRIMHAQNPDVFTTPILAEKFRISPEAVRRILKSKWEPTREKKQKLAIREKMEMRDRILMERVDETKSKIETILEKKAADEEESESYWSKWDPQTRHEAEQRQLVIHRPGLRGRGRQFGNDQPRFGGERQQRLARSRSRNTSMDLFFS